MQHIYREYFLRELNISSLLRESFAVQYEPKQLLIETP